MPLHIWQRQIVDARGFAASGALVEVRVARTNALAELFADRNGETRLPNPMLADSRGVAKFYAEAGRYHIKASVGGLRRVWENVQLGVTLDMINAALFIPQIEQIYERITTTDPVDLVRIMLLALNPAARRLYRSDDDGASWSLWSSIPDDADMMVYHPLTEILVFGNYSGGLLYSEDFGLTWRNCVTNYPTPILSYGSWGRANDGFQFISDYGLIVGLAGSQDDTRHGYPVWSEDGINWFSGEMAEMIFNLVRSGVYHSASGQFFCNLQDRMARTDDGMNYTYALSLGGNSPQNGLGYLPSVGRWASHRPLSRNFVHALDPMSAASWTAGQGTASGFPTNFVTIPARGGIDQHLLVGHYTSSSGVTIYRSFDGISWTALTTIPASFDVTQLLYLEDIHRLVLTSGDNTVGGAGRRIRYSDDGGVTWTEGTGLEGSNMVFTAIMPILVRP